VGRRAGVPRLLWLLAAAGLWLAGQAAAAQDHPYTPPPCRPVAYRSVPDLHAERVCMNLGVTTQGTAPGTFLFLTPGGIRGTGAGIFRDNGQLVWWHPAGRPKAFNLTVVRYRGQPYLALWRGHGVHYDTYDRGTVTLYNDHYQKAGVVTAGRPFSASQIDPHEFLITPKGDALIGLDNPVREKIRGAWTTVLEYVVQKVALVKGPGGIHTGRVLFQWKSLPAVPVSQSYFPDPGPGGLWDYFHGNSIAQDTDGNLIISARNTWGIYKVNVRTGRIMWQLGAKGDRRLPTPWCYQHDFLPLGHGRYSLFDDGGGYIGCMSGSGGHPARGLILGVHRSDDQVRVSQVKAYTHHPAIETMCCGNLQPLSGGDALIDWGQTPVISQYGRSGHRQLDLSLSQWSYRAFRFPWVGRPLTRPAVAAARTSGGTRVWVSWNGATQVAAWQVMAGPNVKHLAAVGPPVREAGFETAISLHAPYSYVAVKALDLRHRSLGRSRPVAAQR
jgi:hypothetical protein